MKTPHDVEKPWGGFRTFAHNEPCTVKIISVNANSSLSKQRHAQRDELWIVLDEGLIVEIDETTTIAHAQQEFFIPKGTIHRLRGGDNGGKVLEVAFGNFDEDDIERLEDDYGRS